VIQTVPNKQGSIDTRDKYGRPLCRVFVEISERVIEVLSEFDIPNVFDLSNPEHLALYVIDDTMMCVQERDIKLAHSDSGTFFSLADLLIGYGFSIGYDGGTKICHYDRFSIDLLVSYLSVRSSDEDKQPMMCHSRVPVSFRVCEDMMAE
jgi:hypothetical protein